MRLIRLGIQSLRRFEQVELTPAPGLNVFVGGNGAGKTSVLEAVHLLAYGRSFRGSAREGLIRRGARELVVHAEIEAAAGTRRVLGLERGARDWRARVDGQEIRQLTELHRQIAVLTFEPGSHALIAGPSEGRRRFVDWALFHVEPEFLGIWRHAQRALQQRNAQLKATELDVPALEAWEYEYALHGERLSALRAEYLDRWSDTLRGVGDRLLPEAGSAQVAFRRGWSGDASLVDALQATRTRDRLLGHTTVGPHRDDWSVVYDDLPARETFSRGQEKLTALACTVAQWQDFALRQRHWPIFCLDDLGSELDRPHLGKALEVLLAVPAQLLLTGTEVPPGWSPRSDDRVFHVEQGTITPLL